MHDSVRLTAWCSSKPVLKLSKRTWARLFSWISATFIAASSYAIEVTEPAGAAHGYPWLCDISGKKLADGEFRQTKTGETVEWVNNDLTPHTVTSDSGGKLNSGSIDVGANWPHTFSQPGTFSYFCTFHREMKGTVIVK